jgi:hypothetical protein
VAWLLNSEVKERLAVGFQASVLSRQFSVRFDLRILFEFGISNLEFQEWPRVIVAILVFGVSVIRPQTRSSCST